MPSSSKSYNVIISGLTAAGKTTHSRLLAQEYGLRYISASEVLLDLAGISLEQPLDFWVTQEGRELRKQISWAEVDDEICRLESNSDNTMFDCMALPWSHSHPCMVIWIESSLPSRVMKAIVSYKGQSRLLPYDVESGIKSKDQHSRNSLLERYGIDLFQNREPFNLILDISHFISAPTDEASRDSIEKSHVIISSAVGWYLYEDKKCLEKMNDSISTYGDEIILRYPKESLRFSRGVTDDTY